MATLEETLRSLGLSAARGIPQLATGFVDLAALPFTATGLLKPEEAVGSTAYLTSKGLLPPEQQGLLNQTTELLSGAINPATATKAALAKGGLLMAAPIAYHGSPYVFDKFDISKVGTGEKNQAQGWGVYLSESMPYAEGFARKELTGAPNVAYRVQSGGEDPMATLKQIFPNKPESWYREQVSKANEKGSLYTVDLPDKYVPKMLDYDKEIKYQQKIVQDVAKKYNVAMDDIGLDLINKVGRTKEGSEALIKEGLMGVKYFIDNGKQKATNYVVFDPSILNILNRK